MVLTALLRLLLLQVDRPTLPNSGVCRRLRPISRFHYTKSPGGLLVSSVVSHGRVVADTLNCQSRNMQELRSTCSALANCLRDIAWVHVAQSLPTRAHLRYRPTPRYLEHVAGEARSVSAAAPLPSCIGRNRTLH